MITFADSHVDLMSNVTFTPVQLMQRWDRELLKKWRQRTQDDLRDFRDVKEALDPETFPNYAENDALLSAFVADKQLIYSRRVADESKNQLLIDTLAHEAALRRKSELELLMNGRDEVIEMPEQRDPETGEITQAYVAPVPGIDPLPTYIEVEGETVENPVYLAAITDLAEVQSIIDGASTEVLALVSTRSN
ncbi:MAG: hypothetical protein P1V33_03545 [Pseudohongiella nitratireducens]|nr:hypothetical protein [Pseudohongiella nitratireducens]MDF1622529.1 hypothetical protein [Pseudohongiella nitratireducens]